MEKIGEKLKLLRIKHNLSQKELAQKLNVSNKLISKWENDLSIPNLDYLVAICKVFDVDLSYFIDIHKTQKQTSPKFEKKKVVLPLSICASLIFIVSIVLLSIYVFAPAVWKNSYIANISKSIENSIDLGYFDITISSIVDDTKESCQHLGLVDEHGTAYAYYENGEHLYTIKDNIKHTSNSALKSFYELDCANTKELFVEMLKTSVDEELSIDQISYVRQTSKGFYLEFKDEVLTKDWSEQTKKNNKIIGKIYANVTISKNLFKQMEMVISYKNILSNERFDIFSTLSFNLEKPQINHQEGIEELTWKDLQIASTTEFVQTLSSDLTCEYLDFDGRKDAFIYSGNAIFIDHENLYIYNLENQSLEKTIPFAYNFYTDDKLSILYVYNDYAILAKDKYLRQLFHINLQTNAMTYLLELNIADSPLFNKNFALFNRTFAHSFPYLYNLETLEYKKLPASNSTGDFGNVIYITAEGNIFFKDGDNNDALTFENFANNSTKTMFGDYVINCLNNEVWTYDSKTSTIFYYNNFNLINQFSQELEPIICQPITTGQNIFWGQYAFIGGLHENNKPISFTKVRHDLDGTVNIVLGIYGDKSVGILRGNMLHYDPAFILLDKYPYTIYDINNPLQPPILLEYITIENNIAYICTSDGWLKISKTN